MKKFIWLLLLAVLPLGAAEFRIGTVNVETVFRDYYRTKQIEEQIKKQAQIFQDYLLKRDQEMKKLEASFKVARDKAQNLALSSEDREKATATCDTLRKQILSIRADMEAYATSKQKFMIKLEEDKRAEVMAEIAAEVRRQAEARHLSAVFDISGRSTVGISAVVYANPAFELTTEVTAALNRGRPAKLTTPPKLEKKKGK